MCDGLISSALIISLKILKQVNLLDSLLLMHCIMSSILLKQKPYKLVTPTLQLCQNILVSSANLSNQITKQSLNHTIKVAKHVKPLIDKTVPEILSEIDPKHTSASDSITILKALRIHTMFSKVPPKTFTSDPKFHFVCEVFQKNSNSLNLNLLISGLRSLLEIGMSSNSPCVVNAEKQILVNCSALNADSIIRCLHFQQTFLETDLQKKVKAALEAELVIKLGDVISPSEVLLLCNIYHSLNETHCKAVEMKIIELVPLLNAHEMCKVIISFAQHSSRNISILNAIAFHMKQKKEIPDIKEIVDILYAFKKLNYVEMRLLVYLCHHAVQEIPNITQPALISGFLVTSGHLKWKYTELLDACADWIRQNLSVCRNKEFIAFILTAATLNHFNTKTKEVLKIIMPFITKENIDSSNILLDVAWSLSILDQIPKELLLHVLSTEFYKPLIEVQDLQVLTINKLKLMNLKGVLKMKYPEHVFRCNLFLEPIKLKDSSDVENSRKHVIKILSNFVPKEKCLSTHQTNDLGIFIDAEFIMDMKQKPLSLVEYGVVATISESSKPLPPGSHRIALLVMFHKDYVHSTSSLSGVNILATKLLTHLGYLVVHVPFHELIRNQTELQKAKYLMQIITTEMQHFKKRL